MTTFTAPLDSDPQARYGYVVERLAPVGLAYLHVIEGETGGTRTPEAKAFDYEALHRAFPGAWMLNNGYSRELAIDSIAAGKADLIAFGRPFISTLDLVHRLMDNLPADAFRAAVRPAG